jgi:hypothetical protein
MTTIVEVPGHGEVEFPEGMSDADISAAIKKNFMIAAPKQKAEMKPTLADRATSYGAEMLMGMMKGGPLGMATVGLQKGQEALSNAAYDIGGAVTDQAAKVLPADRAAQTGFAANLLTQTIPSLVANDVIGKVASPTMQTAGKSLMGSALKPSATNPAKGARQVQTALDEGISVSDGGVEKLKGVIEGLKTEISKDISNSPATVSKRAALNRLQDMVQKFETRPEALQAIDEAIKAETTFLHNPVMPSGSDIPVQLANKLKQGYYASIGEKGYGEVKTVATEAEKAIARGLKEEISSAIPGIAAKNAREGDAISLLKPLRQRVAVEANKNPLGLGALISQPYMIPMWMWDRSAYAKSLAARAMYSGSEQIPGRLGQAGIGYLMMQSGQDPQQGALYKP